MQKFFILISSVLLSSCAVYKIDVQQGVVVTQETVSQLQIGMPEQKVRFILGPPLLIDTFHKNRWDYFYSYKAGHAEREQRHIVLFFDEYENLAEIRGDIQAGSVTTTTPIPTAPSPEPQERPLL
ncbi:outer membrane protein assembly factor BamE [Beggiatoa leptomitoformis]|uniref:Outer membrane protein assembly factor BamE n=1 Tax=Beggiatoa leptomitoformis TaxID=288004 RepID=A0A2N9YDD4_9GAMM|nr:outer membrane protein assembly factor BamE [Beggiatoa leptomitoformis]ALG69076.1 outer membrane protein assembly factor BamE [Beggiatoa leptomitoformis]AUI68513.1 outer membrane protein assembly factor BamE [Beggiatoa leptomitoformis]